MLAACSAPSRVRGLFLVDVTSTVLTRARSYGFQRLGSLDQAGQRGLVTPSDDLLRGSLAIK